MKRRSENDDNSLLGHIIGLSTVEVEVYEYLLRYGGRTAREVGSMLEKDRSTAYRILSRLHGLGLVVKESEHLERGGYYHIYIGREPEAMAEMMLGNTKKWYDRVTALLDGAVRSDEVLLELTASREDLDIFPIREREKRATRPRTGGMGTRRRKTSSGVEKRSMMKKRKRGKSSRTMKAR